MATKGRVCLFVERRKTDAGVQHLGCDWRAVLATRCSRFTSSNRMASRRDCPRGSLAKPITRMVIDGSCPAFLSCPDDITPSLSLPRLCLHHHSHLRNTLGSHLLVLTAFLDTSVRHGDTSDSSAVHLHHLSLLRTAHSHSTMRTLFEGATMSLLLLQTQSPVRQETSHDRDCLPSTHS